MVMNLHVTTSVVTANFPRFPSDESTVSRVDCIPIYRLLNFGPQLAKAQIPLGPPHHVTTSYLARAFWNRKSL